MNTLNNLYATEGSGVLDSLHKATGINRKYLYQIATGRRSPSLRTALKMIEADPRISIEGLLLCSDERNQEPSHA